MAPSHAVRVGGDERSVMSTTERIFIAMAIVGLIGLFLTIGLSTYF
jgi:hypothetical protein